MAITPEGELAGPQWRKFWSKALSDDNLPANPEAELRELTEDDASVAMLEAIGEVV